MQAYTNTCTTWLQAIPCFQITQLSIALCEKKYIVMVLFCVHQVQDSTITSNTAGEAGGACYCDTCVEIQVNEAYIGYNR